MEALFPIIYEDDDLLVVNKPADLVCHPTKTDARSSLIGRLRLHLGTEAAPQMINRLDRETSGLVLTAKTVLAARELRRIWESRQVTKEYTAVVHGVPSVPTGVIDAPLGKDERSPVAIKDCVRPDGKSAQTEYLLEQAIQRPEGHFARLRLRLLSGRKHQIRIHLAHLGHPIVGDKLYGLDEQCYLALVERRLTDQHRTLLMLPCHALHAHRVALRWRDRDWVFDAQPEPWLVAFVQGAPLPACHFALPMDRSVLPFPTVFP